ncbi:hypothetical protein KKB18_11735 [bacterium]|nr:hypothetical protein [bacterium]
MISRNILGFKLGRTKDELPPHAGLVLFGEFAHRAGLSKLVNDNLPKPLSNRGFKASVFVDSLVLMLHGGGRSLEDTRKIKKDKGLRKVLSLKKLPSPDAIGNWLRRVGKRGGLEGLLRVNRKYLECGMKSDGIDGYTLDIDAMGIEAKKYEALRTYKGRRGGQLLRLIPMLSQSPHRSNNMRDRSPTHLRLLTPHVL